MTKARALAALTVAGAGSVVAGAYMLTSLPVALILAGVFAAAAGLLIDADGKRAD